MRIGFCGVGGTGKTTVMKEVAPEFSLIIFPSVARQVMEYLGITERDQLTKTEAEALVLQQSIFDERLRREEQLGEESWISDRTLLDTFCYMTMWCHREMADARFKTYEALAIANLEKYDHIFYFPSNVFRHQQNEGVRVGGEAQAAIMEGLYLRYLERYIQTKAKPFLHIMGEKDLNTRIEQVRRVLKG